HECSRDSCTSFGESLRVGKLPAKIESADETEYFAERRPFTSQTRCQIETGVFARHDPCANSRRVGRRKQEDSPRFGDRNACRFLCGFCSAVPNAIYVNRFSFHVALNCCSIYFSMLVQ